MAQIADDDTDAFGELYDRYSGRAYGLARTICREPVLAEEAVQDGFLSVWKSRGSYSSQRGTVAAWLLTMVRYRAVDTARRNGTHARRQTSEDALEKRPAATPDPADQAVLRDEAGELHALLTQIPDPQREVITLAFFGQLSHTQIATQLDLPTGTVKGRMRLGLEAPTPPRRPKEFGQLAALPVERAARGEAAIWAHGWQLGGRTPDNPGQSKDARGSMRTPEPP